MDNTAIFGISTAWILANTWSLLVVPRTADLAQVRGALAESVRSEFSDPGMTPEFWVDALNDTNVSMSARVPVRSADWWKARSAIQEALKSAIDNANGFAPTA